MKAVFTLLALATSALGVNIQDRGYGGGYPSYVTKTTEVDVTYVGLLALVRDEEVL